MANRSFTLPPPISDKLLGSNGLPVQSWISWLGGLFQFPTTRNPWIPLTTGIMGSPTILGKWSRNGTQFQFWVNLTSCTSTSGEITNLPFPVEYGVASIFNSSTGVLIGELLIKNGTLVNLPNWSAQPIVIFGDAMLDVL